MYRSTIREAAVTDIPRIQIIRHSVRENILSDPALVTDQDCEEYLMRKGRGWVCELEDELCGFAIVSLTDNNVWALFLHPDHEGKGMGKQLHDVMLHWYFSRTEETLWLGTAPATRAERFYRRNGWTEVGIHGRGEIKFEMSFATWMDRSRDLGSNATV